MKFDLQTRIIPFFLSSKHGMCADRSCGGCFGRCVPQRYAAFTNTKSKIGTARRTELINKEREEMRKAAEARKAAELEAAKSQKMRQPAAAVGN